MARLAIQLSPGVIVPDDALFVWIRSELSPAPGGPDLAYGETFKQMTLLVDARPARPHTPPPAETDLPLAIVRETVPATGWRQRVVELLALVPSARERCGRVGYIRPNPWPTNLTKRSSKLASPGASSDWSSPSPSTRLGGPDSAASTAACTRARRACKAMRWRSAPCFPHSWRRCCSRAARTPLLPTHSVTGRTRARSRSQVGRSRHAPSLSRAERIAALLRPPKH